MKGLSVSVPQLAVLSQFFPVSVIVLFKTSYAYAALSSIQIFSQNTSYSFYLVFLFLTPMICVFPTCSDAVDSVTSLYNQVEEQAHILVQRSNMSLEHLEYLLQLREMEGHFMQVHYNSLPSKLTTEVQMNATYFKNILGLVIAVMDLNDHNGHTSP